MDFNKWLEVFLEEKGINIDKIFDFVNSKGIWNLMPLEIVIEYIKQLPNIVKYKIKTMLVKIDFFNKDVYQFFEYLAKGISI